MKAPKTCYNYIDYYFIQRSECEPTVGIKKYHKLKKALYGSMKAQKALYGSMKDPKTCYNYIDSYLIQRSECEPTVVHQIQQER